MNGITVPKEYKYMMKKDRTPEYNEAAIRDFIKANEGKILRGEDFIEALDGLTTAGVYVRKLMKKGNIIRKNNYDGKTGVKYSYTWVDSPKPVLVEPKPQQKIPILEPEEETKDVPEQDEILKDIQWAENEAEPEDVDPIDLTFAERLNQYFIAYCDTQLNPDAMVGANAFRKYALMQADIQQLQEDK